jgi:phosphatidylglycerol---prolipoprotein diacylglyceryl transferase
LSFPFSIQLGNTSIYLHSILETAAFFVGFRYFLFLRKRQGDNYSSSSRIYIIIAAIFGALIGSRLIGSLERPYELFRTDNIFWYVYNNKTVLGGFLGGLFSVELMKKIIREKQASGDLFVYPIILALIIGRVGCFSMGVYEETYGVATSLPWGMNLGDGIMRHPVTLYEIIFLFLLWMVLWKAEKQFFFQNGALFKLFMITYLVFRFLLDFIKPGYPVILNLSTIQLTSLLGILYYLPYIVFPKKLLTPAYA